MKKGILFLLVLCFFPAILWAQKDISVKVEVDKAFAHIGDEINFRVTIEHPPEISVLEVNAESSLSDFEIKKTTPFSTKEGQNVLEGKNYVITTYLLGEYVVNPFDVQYRIKTGEIKTLQTNSLYITMESIDKNKAPDSDIKGAKGVRKLKHRGLLWILLMIAATSGAAAAYWFYQQNKRKSLAKDEEKLLSPHEEAYLALNQLKHSDLIRKGLVKEYFFLISEILRRYFERRYHIRALESTTFELMEELKSKMEDELISLVKQTLEFCDLVKFAKYIPQPLEIISQTKQAESIIDKTKEEIKETVVENAQTP